MTFIHEDNGVQFLQNSVVFFTFLITLACDWFITYTEKYLLLIKTNIFTNDYTEWIIQAAIL